MQINADIPDELTPTPVTDAYLDDLFQGKPESKTLLYEFAGIAFSNVKGWRFKKALFLIGRGDSGKTQIKKLAERIIGAGNFNNTDLTTLEKNRFAPAGFQGKRLCGSNDMSFMSMPEIKSFKQLTGGDNIEGERKFEGTFSFCYDGVLWFVGNQLPLFGGDKGDHVYNRIIPLKCNNVIPIASQNKNICDLMFEERNGFVLNALEAAREAVLNNYSFTIPAESIEALEKYKTDNSELRQFLEDMTIPQDGTYTKEHTTAQIFSVYKTWCVRVNAKVVLSKGQFRRELYQSLGMPIDTVPHHTKAGDFFPVMLAADGLKDTEGFLE